MTINFSIKNLLLIFGTLLLISIVYSARQILLVTVFGMLMAYMLNPLVEKMIAIHIPRIISAIIVLFTAGVAVFCLIIWLIPEIYRDLEKVTSSLPSHISWLIGNIVVIAEKLDIDVSYAQMLDHFKVWLSKSTAAILKWVGSVALSIQHAFAVTVNIILLPIIAFVLLADYPNVTKFLDNYAGTSVDKGPRKYINMFSEVMSSYFRGQIIVVIILCILYTITLKIIGIDAAVFLGMMTGLLSLVPFLGFTIGIVVSLIVALIQFQDIIHPIYVILGYGVVQALETFLITPKVVGGTVGLHPVATMVVLLVGGASFGIIGMVFAIPVSVILLRLYKEKFGKLINPDFKYFYNEKSEDTKEEEV